MTQANEFLEALVFPESDKLDVRNHAEVARRLQVRPTTGPSPRVSAPSPHICSPARLSGALQEPSLP